MRAKTVHEAYVGPPSPAYTSRIDLPNKTHRDTEEMAYMESAINTMLKSGFNEGEIIALVNRVLLENKKKA
jgi:hypothetical protein